MFFPFPRLIMLIFDVALVSSKIDPTKPLSSQAETVTIVMEREEKLREERLMSSSQGFFFFGEFFRLLTALLLWE